jgi:hypothetical protein
MTPKRPRDTNQIAKDESKQAASVGGLFHFKPSGLCAGSCRVRSR